MEKTEGQLKLENEILKTALYFYANPKNWVQLVWVANGKGGFEQVFSDQAVAYHDGGVHARKTLEMFPAEPTPVELKPEEKPEPVVVVVDEETKQIVAAVIARNEKVVKDYEDGKMAALNRLMGECMRDFKGRGNPAAIQKALKEQLPPRYTGGHQTTFGGSVIKTYKHGGPTPESPYIRR